MKKLLGLALTFLLSITCAFALVACSNSKDAELAEQAIGNVWSMYGTNDAKTPQEYKVVGQTRIDDTYYVVDWSVSSETCENITDYVIIHEMDDITKMVTVEINQAEVDIYYTLTATITVGKETRTKDFERYIPAAVVISDGDVRFDLSSAAAGGSALNGVEALALLNSACDSESGLTSVQVERVYQGNGTGGGDYEGKGGFLKMGTSSAGGTLTLVFDKKVDKVVVVAMGWPSGSSTDKLSVNGSEGQVLSKSYSEPFTFEFEPSNEVSIVSADRAFIFEIVVYYAEGVHNHVWSYEHIDGTWTHTKVCTAEGCDAPEAVTENCLPALNVCSCGYEYTEEEILTALFALAKDASLPGTYKLTGVVTAIEEQSAQFGNATFTIKVGDKEVIAYRVKGEGYLTIQVGYTVTVTGTLVDYNGKKEFTSGGTITEIIPGEDLRSDAEKVAAAKAAVDGLISKTYKSKTTVTLPTENNGAELTWSCADGKGLVTVVDGKLTIVELPEEETVVTLTVTIVCGDETDTAEVVITVYPATKVEHAGTAEDPFTVAEALALTNALAEDAYYSEGGTATRVHVAGYVISAGSWSSQYNNWSNVYIADAADMNQADGIQIYRIVPDGTYLKDKADLVKGAYIVVYGYLQNYKGNTPEITFNGQTNVEAVAYEAPENPPVEEKGDASFNFSDMGYDNAQSMDGVAITEDDITVVFDKATGSTPPAYYDSGAAARAYHGNTITVSAPQGCTITKIVMTYVASDGNEVSVNVGTVADGVWTGAAQSVEFLVGPKSTGANGGHIKVSSIEVYYEGEGVEPNPGDHVHEWSYAHVAGTWTHTATCTADGCDVGTKTENCAPALNVCGSCSHEYSAAEIVEALYALEAGKSLPGTYKLTGVVTVVTEQSAQYGNATFTIKVAEKEVVAFRAKGEGYDTLKEGDTVTVTGSLMHYSDGTKEFGSGCSITEVIPGSGEVTPPQPGDHVHDWSYAHVAGTWTHTATCTADGCDVGTKTENCEPALNVCGSCSHEYSAAEIVEALYALEAGKSLPGTYKLTGEVVAIKEQSAQYGNATFTIKVAEKEVVAYRAKGEGYDTLKVGDTVTVTGSLMHYSDGTKEFGSGCSITEVIPGDGETPNPNPGDGEDVTGTLFNFSEMGYVNAQSIDGVAITEDDITVVFDKATGSTAPAYYDSGAAARAYHDNTITVSAPQGYAITKITITYTASDGNEVSVNVGTFASGVWTGSAQSVEFSVGPKSTGANGGHIKVTSIVVEYEEGEGGGSEQPTHTHEWSSYSHVAGTWTHSRTCSAEGCSIVTETANCVPAHNVCSGCGNTYTEAEILTALKALSNGAELRGTYVLTGVVTNKPATGNSGDLKFDMVVNGTTIQAFYVTPGSFTVNEGDTVTVSGPLKNYNGTLEFNNGTITAVVAGEGGSTTPDPVTYTVTYQGGEGDVTGTAPEQGTYKAGDTFKLPECDFARVGYTFDGWNDGSTTYQAGQNYTMPSNDVTFTAQWKQNGTGDTETEVYTWKKVTSEDDLDGATIMFGFANGSNVTIGGEISNNKLLPTVYSTYRDGTFTTEALGSYYWTLAKDSDGNYTFTNSNGGKLNSGSSTNLSTGATNNTWTISIENGIAKIENVARSSETTARQILYQAGSVNKFGYYASSNATDSSYNTIHIFKLSSATGGEGGGEVEPTPDPGKDTTNYGSLQAPLSVAEALALAAVECVSDKDVTAEVVYMKGVVTDAGTFGGSYYSNMYFADAGNLGTTILAYTINLNAGVAAPVVGDTLVICGYIKNYEGTIEFASNSGTYVYILSNDEAGKREEPEVPEVPEGTVTLSFADTAYRTAGATNSSNGYQVWEQNGIRFTNEGNVNIDYANPVRCYQGSSIKVEYTSAMTEIVFNCNNVSYANDLKTSLEGVSGITVTDNGKVVTVVFDTASVSIEFSAAKQLRFDSIEVKA